MSKPVRRKQRWPTGVVAGNYVMMKTPDGVIQMLGYIIGDHFYTPDVGQDKWEVWKLSDLIEVR